MDPDSLPRISAAETDAGYVRVPPEFWELAVHAEGELMDSQKLAHPAKYRGRELWRLAEHSGSVDIIESPRGGTSCVSGSMFNAQHRRSIRSHPTG